MASLYLVDGSNFLFRAYHALPPLSTQAGVPTGAVRGFANMLLRLLDEYRPTHVGVVFDAGGKDKRAELYAAYKQNRVACPPELVPQFETARRLISALGITVLDAVDAEADDLIATLARRAEQAGLPVVIVSSDKDLMQLCREGHIALLDTMKDNGRGKLYGPREVEEKFGVSPAQLGDMLALMGDSSDNLPGVPGIGEKTAAQLIQKFGSLDQLLARIDEIDVRGKDRVKQALREHREQLLLTRRLVALDEAVPSAVTLDELRCRPVRRSHLLALLQELEFNSLTRRLSAPGGLPGLTAADEEAEGSAAPAVPAAVAPPAVVAPSGGAVHPAGAESAAWSDSELAAFTAAPPPSPTVIYTQEQMQHLLAALQQRLQAVPQSPLSLSLQPGGLPSRPLSPRVASLCGVALYMPGVPPAYLPLGHRYLGAPRQLGAAEALALLAPLLASEACRKIVYSVKDAHLTLGSYGIQLSGVYSDPALCSYLLDAGTDHSLSALVERALPKDFPPLPSRESLCQSGKHHIAFDDVDIERAAALATSEARAQFLLGELLRRRLDPAGRALLCDLELPLALVLAKIERHGVLIDVEVLRKLSHQTEEKLRALEAEIAAEAGYSVNLNSPKQLQELLFERLKLTPIKKTKGKTSLSTDAEVLEALAVEHPIARKILEHRGLAKLKSTYMDQFPQLVDSRTGRLHTSYNQVVAATGRLSSTEPNLQNIPIRSELGREIRRAFIASPGHLLIAADYSQIELRVLAHLSQDPLLISSFINGEDVHERTAVEIFGPIEGRRADKRRVAKMINYGIAYGLTEHGLATRLGIERSVAKQYINEYFARYHVVQRFMDELVLRARREGGARTLLGRFRPLPDLQSSNYNVRAYAERIAKNTPLQGTAADILKQAMIDVQASLERHEPAARMLLTVHDELVLEVPAEREAAVSALVRHAMEQAAHLSVPLQVDIGTAANWADCG